jgi:hypothetical protein
MDPRFGAEKAPNERAGKHFAKNARRRALLYPNSRRTAPEPIAAPSLAAACGTDKYF